MTVEGDGVHVITAFVHVHVHNCAFANVQLATVKGSTSITFHGQNTSMFKTYNVHVPHTHTCMLGQPKWPLTCPDHWQIIWNALLHL